MNRFRQDALVTIYSHGVRFFTHARHLKGSNTVLQDLSPLANASARLLGEYASLLYLWAWSL